MSSNKSTMFLSNISIVDHAYIDQRGNIVGGSFNPSFFVSGEIDPVEQVVVDFSAVKKQIKQIIDDKQKGFDHKLWFIHGFSAGTVSVTSILGGEPNSRIDGLLIITPTTTISLPTNAVTTISGGDYSVDSIARFMGEYVQTELRKLHPNVNIEVECVNSEDAHYPTPYQSAPTFRYAHGLKQSTSWGCKNIAHGHLSYIQLLPGNVETLELATNIATDIDDTIFIFAENVVAEDNDTVLVEYVTQERGAFSARYKKDAYNLVILETETTVEHLVEYVAAKYADEFDALSVDAVLVSEGLSKGACIKLGA